MHRGSRTGMASRGHEVAFGEYGLQALERCWLDTKQIEAARVELEQVPGGTAIVDAEEYKRGRATTLKDALDYAPGVYIQPRLALIARDVGDDFGVCTGSAGGGRHGVFEGAAASGEERQPAQID